MGMLRLDNQEFHSWMSQPETAWFRLPFLFVTCIGVAVLGFWTWHRLAPVQRTRDGRRLYDLGVLGFGLFMAVGLPLIRAGDRLGGWGAASTRDFWYRLASDWLFSVPIGLWCGRWFTRAMAVAGIELDQREH